MNQINLTFLLHHIFSLGHARPPRNLPPLFYAEGLTCYLIIHVILFSLHPQTNLSFEAQEVSSPTKNQIQPQWRQKVTQAGFSLNLSIY